MGHFIHARLENVFVGKTEGRVKPTKVSNIMKKFLAMGALALSLAAISQQQASAWINTKFGVGMNFGWQSGGNNLLWGAFRNGQPPAPYGQPGPGFYPPAYGSAPGADFQGMPATAPANAPVQQPTMNPVGYPGYQTVSYPGYGAYYYPVSYGR